MTVRKLSWLLVAAMAPACSSSTRVEDVGSDTAAGGTAGGTGRGGVAATTGAAGAGAGTAASAGAGNPSGDVIAPEVESIAPADGSSVEEASTILITFSEPMDQARTEAAYVAEGSSGPTTFDWNEDGTRLTVDPHLEYPQGSDPAAVEPLSYTFAVGTGATDLAGNSLASEASRTLELAYRRIVAVLEHQPCVDPDEQPSMGCTVRLSGTCTNQCDETFAHLVVGERGPAPTMPVFGVVSFDIGSLPAGSTVETARFETEVDSVTGQPVAKLGRLRLADHTYLSLPTANQGFYTYIEDLIPASVTPSAGDSYSVDVADAVVDDVAGRASNGDRAQFRLYFLSRDFGADDVADAVRFDTATTRLVVTYLVE